MIAQSDAIIVAVAAKKQPLSTWISEIFFEDNPAFGRRSSRVALIGKILRTVPHAISLAFCNFASSYPRQTTAAEPQLSEVDKGRSISLTEWPRHPDTRAERGLPYSDSVATTIDLGGSLANVSDIVFAMKETHRVAADGAMITVGLVGPAEVAADPTLLRAVAADIPLFFSDKATITQARKAEAVGAARLFSFASSADGRVVLRAVKTGSAPGVQRIDIGSGSQVQPGYAGVDLFALPGVTIVRDIDRHGLPSPTRRSVTSTARTSSSMFTTSCS